MLPRIRNLGAPSLVIAFVALFVALSGGAYAAKQTLLDGSDIRDGSITQKDIRNETVLSQDIRDGHVTKRDLSEDLRKRIAERGKGNAQGPAGQPGPAGPTGPRGPAGQSVTSVVIPPNDPRCANGAGGVAYTLGSDTVNVCNGVSSGSESRVNLTDVGSDWESHATATLDAAGWVHLSGYLTCTGASNCSDDALALPDTFGSSTKEVFQLMTEQVVTPTVSSYDQNAGAIVVQGNTLSIPDASTGAFNTLNVWLSGITYKGG